MKRSASAAAPWLIAASGYTALTAAFFWPVLTHLSSAFAHDAIDPELVAAILSWDAHRLPLSAAWWNAPIFWPLGGALSLAEHLLGISLLTTPLQWAGASPLTAYNIAFLAAFPLTALAAHALAFALLRRHDAAGLAGCIFGFNPYRIAQVAHLQSLWVFATPLVLLALHRFVARRDRRWLVAFGVAWLVQAASNGYMMVFLPILLAGWAIWFAREPRRLGWIAAAWAIATLPLAPVLLGYSRFHAAMTISRSIQEIEAFSADLTSAFIASPDLLFWHRIVASHSPPELQLFPGALALALTVAAAAGAVITARSSDALDSRGWRITTRTAVALSAIFLVAAASLLVKGPWTWTVGSVRVGSVNRFDKPLSIAAGLLACGILSSRVFRSAWQRRSPFAFYVVAAAAMLALSFGPRPAVGDVHYFYRAPYYWLLQLPGFSQLRVPARFGMLFVLCVAIAAAMGFARLTAALSIRRRQLLATAAVAIVLIESWPRVTLAVPAAPITALELIDDGSPVLELPLGVTERDADAMYRSLAHRHPLVNGYSGYPPRHYEVLKAALRSGDGAVIAELARDVAVIVVLDRRSDFDHWAAVVGPYPVIAEDRRCRIVRVPKGSGPPPPLGPPVRVQSVTADTRHHDVGLMLDGDLRTAWSTGRAQSGGETLVIDLGRTMDISAVRLAQGPYTMEFPRGLSVDCSADRERWSTCWSGSTAALAMRGMLDDDKTSGLTIRLAATDIRYLRLRQASADRNVFWAVAELSVFGRQPEPCLESSPLCPHLSPQPGPSALQVPSALSSYSQGNRQGYPR